MPAAGRPFRLVIAGCGAITATAHLPAALSAPHIEVTALVDPSVDRAESLARQYNISPRLFSRLEDALPCADGVVIATPNHSHFQAAAKAVSRGIPVLVEKPMTTNYADALALCRMAEENKVPVAVGFNTRHYPGVALMKRLVCNGFFGRIRSLHYEFGSRGGWSPMSMYNIDRKLSGGGVLVVTGSHLLDRLIDWFGYPEILEYRDDSHGGPEANSWGRLRCTAAGGEVFDATFLLSKTAPLRNRLFLETDDYHVELPEGEQGEILAVPRRCPDLRMAVRSREESGMRLSSARLQLDDFVRAALEGGKPLADAAAGSQSVKLTEELYGARQPLREPWMWYAPGEREAAR